MVFSSLRTIQKFTRHFIVSAKRTLDIAITYAPEIQHTSLWPVPVHI
jgi:hypothetical protein